MLIRSISLGRLCKSGMELKLCSILGVTILSQTIWLSWGRAQMGISFIGANSLFGAVVYVRRGMHESLFALLVHSFFWVLSSVLHFSFSFYPDKSVVKSTISPIAFIINGAFVAMWCPICSVFGKYGFEQAWGLSSSGEQSVWLGWWLGALLSFCSCFVVWAVSAEVLVVVLFCVVFFGFRWGVLVLVFVGVSGGC
ncbi:hypothetical protein Dsin_020480 [Dipteronia sinensis]|uniref:Uncharacterized protein n=1 Tax=Dipteronia sinensis TaxID=43782 RepID=A0AAE0AA31_9ROSI|nr:hypothetical protein Dsin_020480 [Dipteronia sinensis]